jgi:hypothetical protein
MLEMLSVFVKYEVQQKTAKNPTPVSAAYDSNRELLMKRRDDGATRLIATAPAELGSSQQSFDRHAFLARRYAPRNDSDWQVSA